MFPATFRTGLACPPPAFLRRVLLRSVAAIPRNVADSFVVRDASIILDVDVDIGHQSFQQLHATGKDKLCKAGKAIRDSMRAHHNTLAIPITLSGQSSISQRQQAGAIEGGIRDDSFPLLGKIFAFARESSH